MISWPKFLFKLCTEFQRQNLDQSVVNTSLSNNISNTNNKFLVGIFKSQSHISQVSSKAASSKCSLILQNTEQFVALSICPCDSFFDSLPLRTKATFFCLWFCSCCTHLYVYILVPLCFVIFFVIFCLCFFLFCYSVFLAPLWRATKCLFCVFPTPSSALSPLPPFHHDGGYYGCKISLKLLQSVTVKVTVGFRTFRIWEQLWA